MIKPLPYHFENVKDCSGDPDTADGRNTCDTPETVRAIKAFNAGFKGMCAVRKKG